MPRTEVYQLRLTKAEKDELAQRAKLQGVSIAKLIRERLNLDKSRTWGGVEVEWEPNKTFDESAWKKLLPPS